MPHRFLDHTADLAVEIQAPTRDALFAEAVAAFTDCLLDPATIEEHERRPVELTAKDPERLLVRWLEEALVAFELDGFLVRRADAVVEPGDEPRLHGTFHGEVLDPERHRVRVLVKGVSYHELRIERDGDGWRATVVFDI